MINVLKKHIREGKRGNSRCCPVALAMLEATGLPPGSISVGIKTATIRMEDGTLFAVKLPRNVWNFIFNFDKFQKVEPFSFNFPKEAY